MWTAVNCICWKVLAGRKIQSQLWWWVHWTFDEWQVLLHHARACKAEIRLKNNKSKLKRTFFIVTRLVSSLPQFHPGSTLSSNPSCFFSPIFQRIHGFPLSMQVTKAILSLDWVCCWNFHEAITSYQASAARRSSAQVGSGVELRQFLTWVGLLLYLCSMHVAEGRGRKQNQLWYVDGLTICAKS